MSPLAKHFQGILRFLRAKGSKFPLAVFISILFIAPYLSTAYATSQTNSNNLALTHEEKAWIAANPVITYGAEKDWPPYDFVDETGKHTGLTHDLLELISLYTGLKFQPETDNWDALLAKTKAQKIDLLPVLYDPEDRHEFLVLTKPYQTALSYFFIHESLKAKTFDDLNNKTLAIPKGYGQIKLIQEKFPKLKLLETQNLDEAVHAVLERKADVLYESYLVVSYLLKRFNINVIKPFKAIPANETQNLVMAIRKDLPELYSIIQKALSAIPEQEKLRLNDKWLRYGNIPDDGTFHLSAAEKQWLAEHPVIRFTGNPDWLPFESFDGKGNFIGMVSEYLKLIEQKLAIKFDVISVRSWNESINKVSRGEVDILSETIDSDLKSHLQFTQSYISSPVVIVMRNDENYVENLDQIRHRRLGLLKNYGYIPAIFRKYPDINFVEFDSVGQGISAVATNKTDALLCNLASAIYYIGEKNINNVRIVGKTEFMVNLGLGVRTDFAPLVSLLNRALGTISQTEKKAISDKWGESRFAPKIDYRSIAGIVAVSLALMTLFYWWNRRLAKEIKTRIQSEQQVILLNQRFEMAARVASLGVWELDLQGERPYFSYIDDRMEEIYGDAAKGKLYWDDWKAKYLHPDDYFLLEESLTKFNSESELVHREFRVVRPDGSIRSIYSACNGTRVNGKLTKITGINWDITPRKKIEQDLEKAKLQAENANLAKTQFLANMSHEIRTPLNAILGFTELMNEQLKDEKLKGFAKTIQTAGYSLLALINDILDLSKIEAGKMRIEKVACNPKTLLNELGQVFMMNIRNKNLDFILDIDPKIPETLMLDATRLRQVLFNLIGNAVKFTEYGHISLRAKAGNEDAVHSKLDLMIAVEDTGIGIAKVQQDLIFKDFEQLEGQDPGKYGGTGLGLAISKRLAELMGGEISLVSEPGIGSTFTLHLRDVAVSSVAMEPKPIKLKQKARFAPAKVLIVDDVADNRNLLKECFGDTKLALVEVENGLEAVNAAKQEPFDLILMDIRMPVMDGYQASEAIKGFSDVPIVALTASVLQDEHEQAKSVHFDGYLRKPALKADLIAELMRFLPYETVADTTPPTQQFTISEAERRALPTAITELERLLTLCGQISKNNNMTEIQKFADSVLAIGNRNQVAAVTDYGIKLQAEIDGFDIVAIKCSLKAFSTLLAQLSDSTALVDPKRTMY